MFSYPFTRNFLPCIAALMCIGLTQIAQAQLRPDMLFPGRVNTRDPIVEAKDLRRANSRRPLGPEDDKRRAIALAITEGNEARRHGKYELAVAAYERAVTLDAKDPRPHSGLGNVYIDLACPDSAIAQYRMALNLKSDFRDALIGHGYALANKQRFDEAETQFQQLLKIKKDDLAGRMGLAFVSWKRKKYDDAIGRYEQIADTHSIKDEDRAAAYLFLGDIYKEREKWDNARNAYKQAIAVNPAAASTTNFISIQAYVGLGLSSLFPAMEQFGDLTSDERTTEDRERMIAMAREAEGYIRRAIYEFKYDHPTGFLVWAFTLEYQFQFRDAERKFTDYLRKVEELEKQLPALAKSKTCDYGFATLRANYYSFQAMSYQQERLLTTDYQKIADLNRKTIECWEQVIKLKADHALAYSSLAGVYISQGKYEAAIEQYDNALSREPDETKKVGIYFGRGSSYASLGRLKEASDDLNRAIKITPEPITYWSLASVYERQGKWEDAIAAADKAISHTKPPTAHSYAFYANLYVRRARLTGSDADYEKAIQLANQAISMNSSYASAYLLLANLYKRYKNGAKADEAIVNYELAARYDPNNPLIYFGLGDLYLGIKNNDNAAIQNLTKAVTLKPDFAPAYYELGLAYSHKGNYAEAAKQFQNAIKYDPKYLNAYLELGDLYSQQKNYEEAIKWMLKATEELPTDYLPYKETARIYSLHQKNEEAIKYYEKSIGLVTGDLAWFGEVMKCRVTRLRAQYSEAIACFQSVKVPNPEDAAQIPYDVGLTHVASGNKQAARSQYEELKRLKSSLAEDLRKQIDQMK